MSEVKRKKIKWLKYLLIGYFLVLITIIGYVVAFPTETQNYTNRSFSSKKDSPFGLLNSTARLQDKEGTLVTFNDVAGIDEVLDDLKEITNFVNYGEKYKRLGAHIPRGIILAGPPGTGKTLIAKAIAGETERPFYTISGSEFVELYVGVGASRVRKLFEEARASGPSIIFIDEIDAIGAKRNSSLENSERIQTLNQLLTEMDGFNEESNVIVIAATNRIESLDPALLRSGRFDRRIFVALPDKKARYDILKLHGERIQLADDVNLKRLSKMTSGASGADLANILNEAAILAARMDALAVSNIDLEEARNRVMFGSQARKLELSQREKITTAYHEAGHAMVSHLVKNATPAEKVTIIPRGFSLGHTEFSSEENKYNYWKNELVDQLAVLLGGRAAEEIFLGDVSSGAQNDIEKATELAKNMILRWGMSDRIGITSPTHFSEETARKVDNELHRILDEAYARAKTSLRQHHRQTKLMAEMLIEFETLEAKDIKAIVQNKWSIEEKRSRLDPDCYPNLG